MSDNRTESEIINSTQADLRVSVAIVHGTRLALESPAAVASTLAAALDHVEEALQRVIGDVMELDDHRMKREGLG